MGRHLAWIGFGLLACTAAVTLVRDAQTSPLIERPDHLGTTWVNWVSDTAGPRVESLVPPGIPPRATSQNRLLAGDVLLSVDYKPVPNREAAHRYFQLQPPGSVVLLQVARMAPSGEVSQHSFFVRVKPRPPFMQTRFVGWWRAGIWLYGLASGAFVVVLVLFAPFLRTNYRRYRNLLLLLVLALLAMVVQFGRYGLVLTESGMFWADFLAYTGALFAVLWVGLATTIPFTEAAHAIPKRTRFWYGLPALVVVAVLGMGVVYWGHLLWFHPASIALLAGLLFHQFSVLLARRNMSGVSQRFIQIRTGLQVLVTALIYLELFRLLFRFQDTFWQAQWHIMLLLFTVLFVFYTTSVVFRFGKLQLVATRTAVLAVALLFVGAAYLGIQAGLAALLPESLWRGILEFALTATLVLAGYFTLQRFRSRIERYITLPQQRRERDFLFFVDSISRYTNLQELVAAIETQMLVYFRLAYSRVYVPPSFWSLPEDDMLGNRYTRESDDEMESGNSSSTARKPTAFIPYRGFTPDELAKLAKSFSRGGRFWSADTEISERELPEAFTQQLAAAGVQLVVSLHFSSDQMGLLLLGRHTQQRTFTFSDIDTIVRLARQAQLTLDVLHLLEKEKVLAQRTLEANLTALRAQINPHFLFNTLNTIASLVHDQPDLAETAIDKLALIFRHTLQHAKRDFVRLDTEIELVRNYLAIEQIRFGKRLTVQLDVDPKIREAPIPALVLQTLIENCIKHGVSKITGPARVSITAFEQDGQALLVVEDNGPGIDLNRVKQGAGLKNVMIRLEKLFESPDRIKFENTGDGTRVEVQLPLWSGGR